MEWKENKLERLFGLVDQGVTLSKEDAVALLNIQNTSSVFYDLMKKANGLSRREYENKGYVFAQIGINSAPCSGNCKFCSLAQNHFAVEEKTEKKISDILSQAKHAVEEKVDALFLMTTADYEVAKFLEIAKQVKPLLPEDMMFIANIGDFDEKTAALLKQVGFTGVYHIVRLNEGIDTDISPEQRIATLDAAKAASLELIYCVEPIGPEHTYDQIAEEMIRARDYNVEVMACMKRVGVRGTPLDTKGEITDLELTKIAAVARLVTRPKRSMNVHEPKQMALLAGINQLYAEIGINPRDQKVETEGGRGASIANVRNMLMQAGYQV